VRSTLLLMMGNGCTVRALIVPVIIKTSEEGSWFSN
jgi:hypothetical protein